ncbi:MAG: electron transfer flavoprotein subunit alpha/FixB family protein [Clostridia bacterium]|nr:electron transfer flavoprotein subunit alpha/FixB family protein [Deltaproteobacteria bacterium]
MNVLIIVEQVSGKPKKATLAGITFGQHYAAKSGGQLHFVIVGNGASAAANEVANFGAAKTYVVEGSAFEHYLVEAYTPAIAAAAKACNATMIAGSATSTTKDLLPRLAARLDAAMASDVLEVVDAKTFKRPMWAGNVTAFVELTSAVKVASVRVSEFDAPAAGSASLVEKLDVAVDSASIKAKILEYKEVKSTRPDSTTAHIVVSGGRGVKSAEGFKIVEQLADTLGAGLGASRAICDAGWVPNDLQIGQTGKIVAPNLYIALGISGAIQHLAGMKNSKTIVAINKDPEAPIFQVTDYGLVGDIATAVPGLITMIQASR